MAAAAALLATVVAAPVYAARLRAVPGPPASELHRIADVVGDGVLVQHGPSVASFRLSGGHMAPTAAASSVTEKERARCLPECRGFTTSAHIGFEISPDDAVAWHGPTGTTTTHASPGRWVRREVLDTADDGAMVVADATSDGIDLRWVRAADSVLLAHANAFAMRFVRRPGVIVADFPPAGPPMPARPFAPSVVIRLGRNRPTVSTVPPGYTGCVSADGSQWIAETPNGRLHLRSSSTAGGPVQDTVIPFGIAIDYPSLHQPCVIGDSGFAVIARLSSTALIPVGANGVLPEAHWRVVWFTPAVQPTLHLDFHASIVAVSPDQSRVASVTPSGVVSEQGLSGPPKVLHAPKNVIDLAYLRSGALVTLDTGNKLSVIAS